MLKQLGSDKRAPPQVGLNEHGIVHENHGSEGRGVVPCLVGRGLGIERSTDGCREEHVLLPEAERQRAVDRRHVIGRTEVVTREIRREEPGVFGSDGDPLECLSSVLFSQKEPKTGEARAPPKDQAHQLVVTGLKRRRVRFLKAVVVDSPGIPYQPAFAGFGLGCV